MTDKIEALALEIGKLGMTDLATKVSAGVYGTGPFNEPELLYDLGSVAGRSGDLDLATKAMALANRIIAGEFDTPAPPDTAKCIEAIWAVTIVEANGQEQFMRFLNSPLMTPDPDKLATIQQIAETQVPPGQTYKIVKFSARQVLDTTKATP